MMYLYLYLPHCGYCGSTDHFQHRYGRDDAEGHYGKGAREEKRLDLARLCYQLADKALWVRNGSRVLVVALGRNRYVRQVHKTVHESAESQSHNIRPQSHPVYDAVIIPGGGLGEDGKPRTFVQARLKKLGHLDTTPSISFCCQEALRTLD